MATEKTEVDLTEELVAEFGENAGYVADLLARYRANPESVDEEWRGFFRDRLEDQPPAESRQREAASAPSEAPTAPSSPPSVPSPGREATPAAQVERQTIRGAALRIAENMEASLQVPT